MAFKRLPTIDQLRNLLTYDPETGRLFWKERPRSMFPSIRSWNCWNTKYAGRETGLTQDGYGYLRIKIFNQQHGVHRIAWALVHGLWPDVVDHINGNPGDNRLVNLRSVSSSVNSRNQKMHSSNSSGITGVSWNNQREKWLAHIRVEGKQYSLGLFENKMDAARAREEANVRFGFHVGRSYTA